MGRYREDRMRLHLFASTVLLVDSPQQSRFAQKASRTITCISTRPIPATAVAWYAKYLPAKLGSLPDRVVIGPDDLCVCQVDNPLQALEARSITWHLGPERRRKNESRGGRREVTMPAARLPVCRKPGSSKTIRASRSNFYRIRDRGVPSCPSPGARSRRRN